MMTTRLSPQKFLLYATALSCLGLQFLEVPSAQADGKRDFYFQQQVQRYFNRQENARTFGMAGSTVATSSDSSSVVGNPAGIGLMETADASITYGYDTVSGNEQPTYRKIEQKRSVGQALGAIPLVPAKDRLPESGNLGFGWTGYDSDYEDDSFDGQTDGYQAHLAYAKALDETSSVGYSLSYFNDSLETNLFNFPMDDGFRHTLGYLVKDEDERTLGASVFVGHGDHEADIFSQGLDGDSELRQYGFEAGGSQRFGDDMLVAVSIDYTYYDTDGDIGSANPAVVIGGDETGHVFNVRAGLEHFFNDWLTGRAGYRYAGLQDYDFDRDELDDLSGSAKHHVWTLGAGLFFPIDAEYIKAVKADYGVEFREVAYDDWTHVITVSMPMDFCKDA